MTRTAPILILTAILTTRAIATPIGDAAQQHAFSILDRVEDATSLNRASDELDALTDALASWAPSNQLDALANAEAVRALSEMIARAQSDRPEALADRFVEHPGFAIELGLLFDPDRDSAEHTLDLALALMTDRPEALDRYPALGAALCVVHDTPRPRTRSVNENRVRATDPLVVFDHLTTNASRLTIAPDKLPPELLVYVVDLSQNADQLEWALRRGANDRNIGSRFFEIQYDYEHFRTGRDKAVTRSGSYTLENILRHGGVCADQAYFAETLGKACGVPSAFIHAKGADVSHAWIGFLQTNGRRAVWNTQTGRYPEYQKLRGSLTDPQTLETVPDAHVGVLSGLVGTNNDARRTTRAVTRVLARSADNWDQPDLPNLDAPRWLPKPRDLSKTNERLKLLRESLTRCAAIPGAWELLGDTARAEPLSESTLDAWAKSLMRLCGDQHPDFAFDTLTDLIASVESPNRRLDLWDWTFDRFRARPDLASVARMNQGGILEELGDKDRAWHAYEDIVTRFLNEGPMCVDALSAMGSMLDQAGRRSEIIPYLENALARVDRPTQMGAAFASQSNYAKISTMLATESRRAGAAP